MTVNMKNWQELKKPNSLEVKSTGDGRARRPSSPSRWSAASA
jgi:hypothetical protein